MVEWVPFSEAAKQLGLSETTLRRRIKDGSIRAEKRQGPYGQQWFVDPTAIQTAQDIHDVVRVDRSYDLTALASVVSEYLARRDTEVVQRLNTLSTAVEALAVNMEELASQKSEALQAELEAVKVELAQLKQVASTQEATLKGELEIIRAKLDKAEEKQSRQGEEVVSQVMGAIEAAEKRRKRWPWQR